MKRSVQQNSTLGRPYVAEIEDLPLYHYLPGTSVLVLEMPGCPLRCGYCDRSALAQSQEWSPYDPGRLVSAVQEMMQEPSFAGIAWSGGEPALHWDNVVACSRAVHECGGKILLATNGGLTSELLADSPGIIDALLIRFKGFSEEAYKAVGGSPELFAQTRLLAQSALAADIHLELLLDIQNSDSAQEQEYQAMLDWMAQELRKDVPLHLRAIAPEHGFAARHGPATPFLENLVESARKQHIGFVYLSNCHGHFFNNTMCPNCYSVVIDRTTRPLDLSFVTDGKCSHCGSSLALVLNREHA